MERICAAKSDWETQPMPSKHSMFRMKAAFTPEEIENLRFGHVPEQMEDKWFFYMEGDTLYAHRSWTGACIYIVDFDFAAGEAKVCVNREEYTGTAAEAREQLESLLSYWTQTPYDYYTEWLEETVNALSKRKS